MPVITRCEVGIYALQKFNGWLIVRILWHKFSVNGEVKDFTLSLLDSCLQIIFFILDNIN